MPLYLEITPRPPIKATRSFALAGGEAMRREARQIVKESKGHRGHIFSLGHGVLRETDPENLREIVKMVHKATKGS